MTTEEKIIVSESEKKTDIKSVDAETEILARDVKWRSKYTEKAQEVETIKSQTEAEKKELESRIENTAKANEAMQKRVIDAELKAQAVAAGLKDLDFLKMIDRSSFKINDDGSIDNLEKAVADFKASKPQLFESDRKTSSSKNATMPSSEQKTAVNDARKMTDEDWAKNKHRFMSGDFRI